MRTRYSSVSCAARAFLFALLAGVVFQAPAEDTNHQKSIDGGVTVYFNDFERDAPGEEWSSRATDVTPKGNRKFLGQFGCESVTLGLSKLAEHECLRVSFELYMIGDWDGSSPLWGPDIIDFGVVGRPLFLHTNFCNCGFFNDNNEQAFPDPYPCRPHPGWTGCHEQQTLGYIRSWGGPDRTFVTDSVYRFSFTFPHDEAKLKLKWTSHSTEKIEHESWGLDNVRVEIVPPAKLRDEKLAELWNDLALDGEDAIRGFHALWSLVAAGDRAVEFLQQQYAEDRKYDEQAVAQWIADLDFAEFTKRQSASRKLSALGRCLIVPLKAALAGTQSAEVRARLESLLNDLTAARPDQLRAARVLAALDAMDTAAAKKLRARLPDVPFPKE